MTTKLRHPAVDLERELLTAEEFLAWLEPGTVADLIDGAIFMHSPVSIRHARLLNFLDFLLRSYLERHPLGELFREVVAVRLSSENVFQPDLAFLRAERRSAIRDNHLEGAPDLVVEVLSPRTADRDVGPKFAVYQRHGVMEYWVLDPEALAHRFTAAPGTIWSSTPKERPGSSRGPYRDSSSCANGWTRGARLPSPNRWQ